MQRNATGCRTDLDLDLDLHTITLVKNDGNQKTSVRQVQNETSAT